ncbi:unnamed protein product [Linum tenue]|uniref:Uncharacterized protein n=1 Tax=Linum tenue TaxID=586396 RepID=A0AAV0P3E3_9ROSI|nr:unnamed protein product [Linum tenue]
MEEGILHKGTRHRGTHSHPTADTLPMEGTLLRAILPPADTLLLLTVVILPMEDMAVTLQLVILVLPINLGMGAVWGQCWQEERRLQLLHTGLITLLIVLMDMEGTVMDMEEGMVLMASSSMGSLASMGCLESTRVGNTSRGGSENISYACPLERIQTITFHPFLVVTSVAYILLP